MKNTQPIEADPAASKPSRLATFRTLCSGALEKLRPARVGVVAAPCFAVAAPTTAGAQFNPRNGYGITQCMDNGENLFLGNGFHIIGSKTGADNDDNVDSMSPRNSNGMMISRNPTVAPLPYSLTFTQDKSKPNRVYFSASVGPSKDSFTSLSIPLECRMTPLTYWRANTSTATKRYDQNPFSYSNAVGNYYIGAAANTTTWGEIVGVKSSIRVTVTSSTVKYPTGFVNAPDLSTGDRDVEFGFGPLPAGKKATIAGYIDLYPTDRATLPYASYPSLQSGNHQVGRKDGDGWSVSTKDKAGSYLQYGPYQDVAAWGGVGAGATSLPSGRRMATYRLMLDNVTSDNSRILTVDVYDAASGRTLARQDLKRKDFDGAMKYKDFDLAFDASPGQRLEFRTYWWGGSYARQQGVFVR